MKGIPALSLLCVVFGLALVWNLNRNAPQNEAVSVSSQNPGSPLGSSSLPPNLRPSEDRSGTAPRGRKDGISLLKQAFAETREIRAMALFMEAMSLLNPETLPGYRGFFSNLPLRSEQLPYWRLFYSAWGEFDGTGAIAHIKNRFEDVNAQRLMFASVATTWKNQDPAKTIEFMASFLPSDAGDNGQLALDYVKDLAKNYIDRAVAYGIRLNDPEFVMELTGQHVRNLLKEDFTAATSALETLSGDTRDFATSQFLSEWSTLEPTVAADWLSENYYSSVGLQTLSTMAANYVKTDPSAAMAWVYSLPNDASKAELIGSTVSAWASIDPASVATWLAPFSSSKELDPAVIAYTKALATSAPATALENWIPRIADPLTGEETLYHLAMNWEKENPEEFRNWANNTAALEPIQKQRLLVREFQGNSRPPNTTVRSRYDRMDSVLLNNGRTMDAANGR